MVAILLIKDRQLLRVIKLILNNHPAKWGLLRLKEMKMMEQ
jgi:hypothetical protein